MKKIGTLETTLEAEKAVIVGDVKFAVVTPRRLSTFFGGSGESSKQTMPFRLTFCRVHDQWKVVGGKPFPETYTHKSHPWLICLRTEGAQDPVILPLS